MRTEEHLRDFLGDVVDAGPSLQQIATNCFATVLPPDKITVAEAAERHLYINNVGSYIGPWDNDFAGYLVEPQEVLTQKEVTAMVVVGPARAGKTQLLFNWIAHSALYDPAAMLLIHMTKDFARDWSVGDWEKYLRDNPDIGSLLSRSSSTHDQWFDNGMRVQIKWPAISEMSGKTVPRGWLADYDRMPQDIGKEGSPFFILRKRGETFRRNAMFVAESSPGFPITDPRWQASPEEPHEGPPCDGIVSIYNQGDRRRLYWRCVACKNPFIPSFIHLKYPKSSDFVEASQSVHLECPHCSHKYRPDQKAEMNLHHVNSWWLKEGQSLTKEGQVVGRGRVSDIASFWIPGEAAAFAPWSRLVLNWLNANAAFAKTGIDTALKNTVNLDQGMPYCPKSLGIVRDPIGLKSKAEDFGDREVPEDVRFLVASIDTQRNRFEVQVHGFTAAASGMGVGDIVVIDRFALRKSERLDEDGEHFPLSPPLFPEDWHILIREVMLKRYPLQNRENSFMSIAGVAVDAYGKDGTTKNAYNFFRFLRTEPDDPELTRRTKWSEGLHDLLRLTKGEHSVNAPRTQIRYPDSEKKDAMSGARGEIPVLFLNTTQLKDAVMNMVDQTIEGSKGNAGQGTGRVRVARWLADSWYRELFAEARGAVRWENPTGARNESFDLLYAAYGYAISSRMKLESMNWAEPEPWAEVHEFNSLVTMDADDEEDSHPTSKKTDLNHDLAKLGQLLA